MLDRDTWYKLRDDRTNRMEGSNEYEDFSLGVVIDPNVESSFSLQIMALVTVNILARWCRNIRIQLPTNVVSIIPYQKGENLRNYLKKLMSDIDPYGQFSFGDVRESDYSQVLVIGNPPGSFPNSIWINSSGWIAGVGCSAPNLFLEPQSDNNPIGAAFASCLGVAEVFRQAVSSKSSDPYSVWYSLFDFAKTTEPTKLKNPKYTSNFDFGRICQIGCGAVGSSLNFLLSLTDWKGEITLIDYDSVDYPNCSSSLSFNEHDAVNKKKKIEVCQNILQTKNLTKITFDGSFSDYVSKGKYLDNPPDLILCLANEKNVWADIQYNFPPIVFHATTTQNWGINFGRHIPKKEWCIMCRFSNEIDHKFTPPCGEGVINLQDDKTKQILGVLPFLSPASAVLVLAEMAKISLVNYPINKNFIDFSLSPPSGISLQMRKMRTGCICNNQNLNSYPSQIRKSKFWSLVG